MPKEMLYDTFGRPTAQKVGPRRSNTRKRKQTELMKVVPKRENYLTSLEINFKKEMR